MTHSSEVKTHVHRCWSRGDNIRATMISVKKFKGVSLSFEETRLMFVELTEMYSPGSVPSIQESAIAARQFSAAD